MLWSGENMRLINVLILGGVTFDIFILQNKIKHMLVRPQ